MKLSTMFLANYLSGKVLTKPILAEIVKIESARLRPVPDKPEVDTFVMIVRNVDVNGHDVPLLGVERINGGYRVVLRQSLAEQIAGILGADDTDDWKGGRVVLYGEPTRVAGKDLIALRARAPKTKSPEVAK